jgi:Transposase DDE domain
MNTFQLYRTWKKLLAQWLPEQCPTRLTNLAWLIVGLCLARKVQASAIVKQWPLTAKVTSLTRRLSRFLDNPAVQVSVWYRPVARRLLERWAGQTATLIIDATRVGAGYQLILVAVAYHRRALPLAWSWVPWVRGHSPARVQLSLLQRVRHLLPPGVGVTLVGDAGFGSVALLRQATAWGWGYVLRQTGKHRVQVGQADWQPFRELVTQPGQSVWWPQASFTRRWQQASALLAHWQVGERGPWLLTTNLASARETWQAYRRRMWIEEMFGDLKRHGLDLEATHLRHRDRLSRLTLAVCLLYVWLVLFGRRLIQAGWRPWVDRRDRRDLSVFRIGLDVLERCLVLALRPPVALPTLVSGS